jgi:outer membrane protein
MRLDTVLRRSTQLALVCGLAAACISFISGGAGAASAPATAEAGAPKIAVIDTEKILLGSEAGKAALADLKRLQEQREGEARTRQQEIKDLQTRIASARASGAKDELARLEASLAEKTTALRRFQDDATAELTTKRDSVLAVIDQKVMPAINQIGKEGGYTLIFRKFESGLIYADEAVDITNAVIQRLDRPAGGQ